MWCHLPSGIYHLPFAICHSPSAIRHLPTPITGRGNAVGVASLHPPYSSPVLTRHSVKREAAGEILAVDSGSHLTDVLDSQAHCYSRTHRWFGFADRVPGCPGEHPA